MMPQPSGEFSGQEGTGAALFIAIGLGFVVALALLPISAPARTRATAVAERMDFMVYYLWVVSLVEFRLFPVLKTIPQI
jgi:hypothetical protein